MIFLQGIGIIILMIFVPLLIGEFVRRFVRMESSAAIDYVLGMLTMWALFQIWAVPLILLKSPFLLLVIVWVISMVIPAVLQVRYIWKNPKEYTAIFSEWKAWWLKWDKKKITAALAAMLMCGLIAMQGFMYVGYQHTDADDSRFVVNALEAYENNTMLLNNPMNGNYEGTWVGDLPKDTASPWSIYIAAASKVCGVHPTIFAHSILPVFLLLTSYGGYWLLGGALMGKSILGQSTFVMLCAFLNLFFGSSVYTESTFLLTRVWQGKAVAAGVMFPLILWLMVLIYQEKEKKGYYLAFSISMFAVCLVSGTGILLGTMFAGCFGLVYALFSRSFRMVLQMGLACVPNVIYALIYFFMK